MTTAIRNYAINGYVGTGIETGTATNGAPYARFRLGHTPSVRNEQGQWEDGETTWYNCTAWNNLARKIADHITKGTGIIAVGTLTHSSYIDKEGNAATSANLRVTDMGLSIRMMKTDDSTNLNATTPEDEPPF